MNIVRIYQYLLHQRERKKVNQPPETSQISVTSLPSLYGSINFVRSLLLASYITGFWGGTETGTKNMLTCLFFAISTVSVDGKKSWKYIDYNFNSSSFILTYNSKINFQISRRWVAEVDATSVHALIVKFDVVDKKLGWMRRCSKKCSTAKGSWWWP